MLLNVIELENYLIHKWMLIILAIFEFMVELASKEESLENILHLWFKDCIQNHLSSTCLNNGVHRCFQPYQTLRVYCIARMKLLENIYDKLHPMLLLLFGKASFSLLMVGTQKEPIATSQPGSQRPFKIV